VNSLKLALAQINPVVGDIEGNAARIIASAREAAALGADLCVFPEMAITGYPPEDLVFKSSFQRAAMEAVGYIARSLADCSAAALFGGLWMEDIRLYNTAFLVDKGQVAHRQYKRKLPNYGVFDEKRLFAKGPEPEALAWRGIKLGVLICEDVWDVRWPRHLDAQGAELLIAINASPYEMGKAKRRKEVVEAAALDTQLPVIYLNMVGGQDELVFDGRSFAVDRQGQDIARLPAFHESLSVLHLQKQPDGWSCASGPMVETQGDMDTIYQATVLGLRDYVEKNGFKGVVIGLSGGIDSGLTAAVAVDALGAAKVRGVFMPSCYTSPESAEDAEALAKALAIVMDTIPIASGMAAFASMLGGLFEGQPQDTTEENIQARIRGNLLMAISNKFGSMVLTTGNKSEMSVGYATLYGDMCGGYSVLKDVYKTTVFKLSRWRNLYAGGLPLLKGPKGEVIPERMITKPPSAELKPNQKDEDSLPPYEVLDAILYGLVERQRSASELVSEGFEAETVARVAKMIYTAEYKRRQSPPGVKVSGMSFGRDRRYPITNKWPITS